MRLLFCKSKWEMWDDPLDAFLRRVKDDGFDATELYLHPLTESPDEIAAAHRAFGLDLVGQILTAGASPEDHLRSLEQQCAFALACNPILVNCHAGRDRFSFEDNRRILTRIAALSREHGIPFLVETHRGRPTYSAIETRRYLEALPDLRLTLDVSHWMVVHESDLSDQPEALDIALRRSDHIHARVGYEEGPQITDPRAPEWEGHVENHLALWQRIANAHRTAGADVLTVTPEFGPPQYMHTLPFTNQPIGDTWAINVYMKDLLRAELRG